MSKTHPDNRDHHSRSASLLDMRLRTCSGETPLPARSPRSSLRLMRPMKTTRDSRYKHNSPGNARNDIERRMVVKVREPPGDGPDKQRGANEPGGAERDDFEARGDLPRRAGDLGIRQRS